MRFTESHAELRARHSGICMNFNIGAFCENGQPVKQMQTLHYGVYKCGYAEYPNMGGTAIE